MAPCLLTNDLASVVRLRVLSPRYHALCLLPRRYASHAVALAGFKILVKRKAGHLSHAADASIHKKRFYGAARLAVSGGVVLYKWGAF